MLIRETDRESRRVRESKMEDEKKHHLVATGIFGEFFSLSLSAVRFSVFYLINFHEFVCSN